MSLLETPRINFKGQISWDPIVTNNYESMYDEANAKNATTAYHSAEEFRAAAASKDWIAGNGNWNPHGTHRSVFFETEVHQTETAEGPQTEDSFIGSPVNFKGMLVDCEPYGSMSSQLFFDTLNLGILGGCRISAKRSNRMTARYINFGRLSPRSVYAVAASGASVNWQTTFLKEDIIIDAFDSVALQALKLAMSDPDVLGLVYRFNAYSTHYYGADTDTDVNNNTLPNALVEKIAGGGFQPNPARSTIVGSIGLWRTDEPVHEPGDRALLSTVNTPNSALGNAAARISTDSITIDFSNTVPEVDLDKTKMDLGDLNIFSKDCNGDRTTLGKLQYSNYDKAAYNAAGGIITLPLTEEQVVLANSGTLGIQKVSTAMLLLEEIPIRAIPEIPNIYLEEGDTTTVKVRVLNKGIPAGSGIKVTALHNGESVDTTLTQTTDDKGIASFAIKGVTGSVQGYLFQADPMDAGLQQINPPRTTYMYIRVYPSSPLRPGTPATWENVYKHILINWKAMAPCMDNWLDLADENQVLAYADTIKHLTDPKNFEMFLFMPVTRDMPQWQRTMLYEFLDGNTHKKFESDTAENGGVSIAALSRSMRSPIR